MFNTQDSWCYTILLHQFKSLQATEKGYSFFTYLQLFVFLKIVSWLGFRFTETMSQENKVKSVRKGYQTTPAPLRPTFTYTGWVVLTTRKHKTHICMWLPQFFSRIKSPYDRSLFITCKELDRSESLFSTSTLYSFTGGRSTLVLCKFQELSETYKFAT